MKVLVLAPHPFFQQRGTPIAVRALVQVLSRQAHAVDLLTYHEGEDVDLAGARLHRIPRIPTVRNLRPGFSAKKLVCDAAMLGKCISLVRKNRYDVIHAVEESAFLAVLIKKTSGIPFVYDMDSSLAGQMMERFPTLRRIARVLRACERLAVRESLAVVAVCRAVEQTAREYQRDKPILRLEDFSLLSSADGVVVDETLRSIPAPRAMYVGNLEPYQGIDLLLKSFRVVKAQGPGCLVVIGGKRQDISRYRRQSAQLGIEDRVFFLGPKPLDHLAAYLAQADVLVSPRTQGSNTPMKVYSYLDSGRPLLATRLPTHTQVLDDEIALLVSPEASSMGRGLVRLFRDPGLSADLARRARDRVEREFSFEAFSRKLSEFYRTVQEDLLHGPPEG